MDYAGLLADCYGCYLYGSVQRIFIEIHHVYH